MAGHAEGRQGEVASGDVGRQLTGYAQNHHQKQELEEVRSMLERGDFFAPHNIDGYE